VAAKNRIAVGEDGLKDRVLIAKLDDDRRLQNRRSLTLSQDCSYESRFHKLIELTMEQFVSNLPFIVSLNFLQKSEDALIPQGERMKILELLTGIGFKS